MSETPLTPRRPPSLREDLALEAAHYHLPAQAGRFAYLFATTLGAQVLSGASLAGWAALRSLLLGAAVVAWPQWRKTMPAPAAQRVADEHQHADAPVTPSTGRTP